jgi:copper chaperone CopZ
MSFVLPGLCGVCRFPVHRLREQQVLALPGSGPARGDVVSWLAGSLEGGGGMSSAALTGEAPSGLREVELSIQGMTCAACAARVGKKLNTIENVFASVNFATEKATVTVPASVAVQELIEKIEQAGYGAEVVGPASGAAGGGSCLG